MKKFLCFISLLSLPLMAGAQGWAGQAEGSRPGQTYGGQQTQQAPQYQQQGQYQQAPQQQQAASGRRAQASSGQPMILEFSDLQCPDSARYNRGLKQDIMRRYVSSGQVGYEWHDFPLPSHSQAPEAAAAARCGGASADRMRLQIMGNQGQMSAATYTGYARQMGVNASEFSSCLRGGSSMQAVQSDRALGQSYGVRGTPTLVLGTKDGSGQFRVAKVVKGYDPPQQVIAEIDSFLASAGAARQQHTR